MFIQPPPFPNSSPLLTQELTHAGELAPKSSSGPFSAPLPMTTCSPVAGAAMESPYRGCGWAKDAPPITAVTPIHPRHS